MSADIEEAIKSRLDGFTALTDLVSTRIYFYEAPQSVAFPVVVFQRISTQRPSAMGADIGIARARFQVSVFGDVHIDVRNAAQQVRAALQRWNGTEATVTILETFIKDEHDQKSARAQTFLQEAGVVERLIDVEVNYRE